MSDPTIQTPSIPLTSNGRAYEVAEAGLTLLPRWARVAFAVRCVQRVTALLPEVSPQTSSREIESIERAIAFAEASAREGKPIHETASVLAALEWTSAPWPSSYKAKGPADHLRTSIGSAAAALVRAAGEDDPHQAFEAYWTAAEVADRLFSPILLLGMRRDFLYLQATSVKEAWTDQTPVAPTSVPRPQLKLAGLHIRDLRAIRQLDLPQDGLAWQGQVPDVILFAGLNGCGKTTLLNFLTDALALLLLPIYEKCDAVLPKSLDAREAWVEFDIESYELARTRMRFLVGDDTFVKTNQTDNSWWIQRLPDGSGFHNRTGDAMIRLCAIIERAFSQMTIPSLVFLPSEARTLLVPGESYKAAGRLTEEQRFVHRWQPPAEWKESLEALLYGLRWQDLNAKEEGRFSEANNFATYASALRRFTGDSKSLMFERGELVVRIAGSEVRHGLDALSSGEKQVLLLTGELLRHWRPGSLILIDEPELHLHSRWQTSLYQALRYWQKERGGQVILATQSNHLVGIADVAGMALLGHEAP